MAVSHLDQRGTVVETDRSTDRTGRPLADLLEQSRPQLVKSANYVRIEDGALRRQIERRMIKFLKSHAVLNAQHVERE